MALTDIGELPELYEGLKEVARHNPRSLRGEIIACPEHHVERLPCWRTGFRLRRRCARGCHVSLEHALVEEYDRPGRP